MGENWVVMLQDQKKSDQTFKTEEISQDQENAGKKACISISRINSTSSY